MNRPVVISQSADEDIQQIVETYEALQGNLGYKFLLNLRKVFETLELMPLMYGLIWQDVRAVKVNKFSQIVYYVVLDDTVEIIAVLHSSRHESIWQARK